MKTDMIKIWVSSDSIHIDTTTKTHSKNYYRKPWKNSLKDLLPKGWREAKVNTHACGTARVGEGE